MPSPQTTPDTRPVQVLRDNAVAILQFNRPDALNALDVPTARAFHAACVELATDAGVRAVIVRGAGRAFGVGGDLAAMRGDAAAVAARLI